MRDGAEVVEELVHGRTHTFSGRQQEDSEGFITEQRPSWMHILKRFLPGKREDDF